MAELVAEWEHTHYTHSGSGVGLAQHQLGHSRWDQCSEYYENVCIRIVLFPPFSMSHVVN